MNLIFAQRKKPGLKGQEMEMEDWIVRQVKNWVKRWSLKKSNVTTMFCECSSVAQ